MPGPSDGPWSISDEGRWTRKIDYLYFMQMSKMVKLLRHMKNIIKMLEEHVNSTDTASQTRKSMWRAHSFFIQIIEKEKNNGRKTYPMTLAEAARKRTKTAVPSCSRR